MTERTRAAGVRAWLSPRIRVPIAAGHRTRAGDVGCAARRAQTAAAVLAAALAFAPGALAAQQSAGDPPRFATAVATVHASVQVMPAVAVDDPDRPGAAASPIMLGDRPIASLLVTDRVPVRLTLRPAQGAAESPSAGGASGSPSGRGASGSPSTRLVLEIAVLF